VKVLKYIEVTQGMIDKRGRDEYVLALDDAQFEYNNGYKHQGHKHK
jgi:hypothetical protein